MVWLVVKELWNLLWADAQPSKNRHDRRTYKALNSTKRTDGRYKYETPSRLTKAGRQIQESSTGA